MKITFESIGIIHSPFKSKEGMPIQAAQAEGTKGRIVLNEELSPGLTDLDGFSHIILIYYLHQSSGYDLLVTPFLDDKQHGVFSTRAPKRPNAIGLSVVKLERIEENSLYIGNVDILDETPLLDIKPYIPWFDIHQTEKNGWVEGNSAKLNKIKSDKRFK